MPVAFIRVKSNKENTMKTLLIALAVITTFALFPFALTSEASSALAREPESISMLFLGIAILLLAKLAEK